MSVKARIKLETEIVTKAIDCLLKAGYALRVNDGEVTTTPRTTDRDVLLKAIQTTDEDYLYVYKSVAAEPKIGWVRLTYGNDGWDVISDYTTNLEEALKPVNDYVAENF